MSRTSLSQWLEYLEGLHPKAMDLGLERVAKVAGRLQLLPLTVPVISIAGTNGKGTTAAVLESLLSCAGYRVGLATSPHFLRFNERIRVAREDADDAQIMAAFEQIEQAREAISLTYFEFAILATLIIFRQQAVDVAVLEVGLGGRLDAVNIVDASVAVITSIALDHQDWLGDTRDCIAVEKAGIMRAGRAAVIAEANPPESLRQSVIERGAVARYLGEDFFVSESATDWQATLRRSDGQLWQLPTLARDNLHPSNISAALQTAMELDISFDEKDLTAALSQVHLRGRLEQREVAGRHYLLDVAHNAAAALKLQEYLVAHPIEGRTIALFSVMADKDISSLLQPFADIVDAWFLADQANNPRAAKACDIATQARSLALPRISVSKNLRQAFRRAQTIMANSDRLLVFGSFFTVAAVLPMLEKEARRDKL